MTTEIARHIPIEGTHNFRDAGGYPTADGRTVRWRTLFRSDSLHAVTDAGREAIRGLGIRTAIDLRAQEEVSVNPSIFATEDGFLYANLPLAVDVGKRIPRADTLEDLNRKFLDHGTQSLYRILKSLTRPNAFPAVVNCAAGKDRTGLVTALLLSLAGVKRDDVIEDYVLTGVLAPSLLGRLLEDAVRNGRERKQITRMMECRAEVMDDTLTYIETQYGGAESYAHGIGLSDQQIASLRESLVEG